MGECLQDASFSLSTQFLSWSIPLSLYLNTNEVKLLTGKLTLNNSVLYKILWWHSEYHEVFGNQISYNKNTVHTDMDNNHLQSYISCTSEIHVLFIYNTICLHYINFHNIIIKTVNTTLFIIQTTFLLL